MYQAAQGAEAGERKRFPLCGRAAIRRRYPVV